MATTSEPLAIAASQLVDVTCTLTDSNDSLWAGARVVVTFVAPPNTAAPYLFNGQPFQLKYRFDNVGPDGTFSVELPPNIDITPEGHRSLWRFDIGPNWDNQVSATFSTQVAGPAMDLSPSFKFASEQLIESYVQSMPVPRADQDANVIIAPNDGQIFYNTSEQVMKFWANDGWNGFGEVGEQGPIGPTGPQGATGPTGPQGPTGNIGPVGPTGPQGEPGRGVTILGSYPTFEALVAAHPTGNVGDGYLVGGDLYVWDDINQEWNNVGTIQGPQGAVGPQGPQGIQGNPGTTGPSGATGPQGPIGNTGPTGAIGPQGPIGNTGPVGPIGPQGPTIYPPAGVAVSSGSAWNSSIDPATLARLNANNNFTQSNVFNGPTFVANGGYLELSTNNAQTPIAAGGYGLRFGWNAAGGYESDFINANNYATGGFNWYNENPGTTINSSITPGMFLDSTNMLRVAGHISGGGNGPTVVPISGCTIAWNTTNGGAETCFINSNAGLAGLGGFRWFNNAPGSPVDPNSQSAMSLDANGSLGFLGSLLSGAIWAYSSDTELITNPGGPRLNMRVGPGSGSATVNAPYGTLYLNWDSGNNGVIFGDGNANRVAAIDQGGNAAFAGHMGAFTASIASYSSSNAVFYLGDSQYGFSSLGGTLHLWTAPGGNVDVHGGMNVYSGATFWADLTVNGAKNFRITHPLDSTKDLVHSVVEGPECAVFYRGEAATQNGVVEIMLPDYFEALTLEEDRTVQLTELIDDEDNPMFGCFLATTKVKNGKFKVRSSVDVAKFYWEVKAVRKDIPKLVVERPKEEVANATGSK